MQIVPCTHGIVVFVWMHDALDIRLQGLALVGEGSSQRVDKRFCTFSKSIGMIAYRYLVKSLRIKTLPRKIE